MEHKVLAIVKFNQGEAFVLEQEPVMKYKKYGNDTIIGTDGVFYVFYGYERPSKYAQAFGGRKFSLTMEDGEVIECSGQWWDSLTDRAVKELGINNTDNRTIRATACSIDNLKRCYVFHGYTSLGTKITELINTYNGPVYEYYEYEKILLKQKSITT
jgi:hypothetical protein